MSNVFSSWKNLRRAPYQSLTALLVVITTFFVVFILSTFLYLGNQVLKYFETRPQILVFFETTVTDAEATAQAQLLRTLSQVNDVRIIGKSEAHQNYLAQHQDDQLLRELLHENENMFPVSLSITAKTPAGLDQIRQEIEKLDGVETIDYRQDVIKAFLSWTDLLRKIGFAICGLFTVQFVLVIMVITAMKVSGRRRSINIMSILGASGFTIKGTFIREGMWLGFIGSLIAFLLNYGLLLYLTPTINSFLGEIKVLPLSFNFLILQVSLGSILAIMLAGFSAWLATTRLIKK